MKNKLPGVISRTAMLLVLASSFCFGQMPVIFDTDMGNDIDDALALGILHALMSRGECRLIGVTLTNSNPAAVPYVQMIDRFYGRGAIPIGSATQRVKDGDNDGYLSAALRSAPAMYRETGKPAAVSAVALLRRLLAASPAKVTIVQVGFSTNLAALLDSPPDAFSPKSGRELVKDKVALVSAMAGNFAEPKPEYNVKLDIAAARKVFEQWPAPIVLSGFEIGRDLLYPGRSIEKDYAYGEWHPLAVSYRAYSKMPYDRPTWDLTAVLEAVRGEHRYFKLSALGKVMVAEDGVTRFAPGSGDRRYLLLDPAKRGELIAALTLLASEPPHR